MILNLATDIAGGTSGPLTPSSDNLFTVMLIVLAILLGLVLIIVLIVNLVRNARYRKNNDENVPPARNVLDMEMLTSEEKELIRQRRKEFASLTDEEKELIRKHREQSKEKDD